MSGPDFTCFGQRRTFALEVRLAPDPHAAEAPHPDGWSFGELRIFVRDRCLTRHTVPDGMRDGVRWYLAPLLRWLGDAWLPLLHEQAPPGFLGTHENFVVRFEQGERLAIDDETPG